MDARADAIVTAVRECVGTRFRPQGRLSGVGLDCVGVVLVAARAAGCRSVALPGYALGGEHDALIEPALRAAGGAAITMPRVGDVLVLAPSPGQRHLAVVTPAGVVHAHAGPGRVVEGPVDAGWAMIGAWRLTGRG